MAKQKLIKIENDGVNVWATTEDGKLIELFWESDGDDSGYQPMDELYKWHDAKLAGLDPEEARDLMAEIKRPVGRPKKSKGQKRESHNITLSPYVSRWLKKQAKGNISKASVIEQVLLAQIVDEDGFVLESTLGTVSDEWGSLPWEWGHGEQDAEWDRDEPVRLVRVAHGEYQIEVWCGYEDDQGYIQDDWYQAIDGVNVDAQSVIDIILA